MVAMWANIDDPDCEKLVLTGYDIVDNRLLISPNALSVKRIYNSCSACYYDKRTFPEDTHTGILTAHDGLEAKPSVKKRLNPTSNSNILGYMVVDTSGFDNPDLHSCLLVGGIYNGNGFYLRSDNYTQKLPMFCASRYITYNREWTERARIMKSADGAVAFRKDVANGKLTQFLLKCLLFTCLEMQNHMRSFVGSDGRFYRNELCLDGTNGETIALLDIKKLVQSDKEKELLRQWETVLRYAKSCEGYNEALTYGVYQIFAELDTSHKDDTTGETIWDNVELHSALQRIGPSENFV